MQSAPAEEVSLVTPIVENLIEVRQAINAAAVVTAKGQLQVRNLQDLLSGYKHRSVDGDDADGDVILHPGSSYYISASALTTSHYQALVNRGWRRSGVVLYKPDLKKSCCPHYTIRLDTTEFKPSKDQRQCLNRWSRYVLGDQYIKDAARLHPKSKEESKRRKTEFDMIEVLHACEDSIVKRPPIPDHTFKVTLEPDNFTTEKYDLFANYQRCVHHEPPSKISKAGFRRFLCSSPLIRQTRKDETGRDIKFGSFHQCYRLDGRLIAMGVIDLLPGCVSGVYFIYHEDFSQWHFGKLGALREAALAKESGYRYYYMGYYIHSCVKMRYKADYKPQYVLDPETYGWDSLDREYKVRLDQRAYVSLSRERLLGIPASASSNSDQMKTEPESKSPTSKESQDDVEDEATGSLFAAKMPGVMTLDEVESTCNLDDILVSVSGEFATAECLRGWSNSTVHDEGSIKEIFAEFAACVGPDLIQRNGLVISFG